MVDQFQHGEAFLGVLVEAAEHEVPGLVGQRHSLRKVNILVDYLAQVLFRPYFEWDPAEEQLVGEDACVRGGVPMFQTSILLSYCCFCTTSGGL